MDDKVKVLLLCFLFTLGYILTCVYLSMGVVEGYLAGETIDFSKRIVSVKATTTMKGRNPQRTHRISKRIDLNISLPLLTLFTTLKTKPEKYLCHNITLYNWNSLKPVVYPILFTSEKGVRTEAIEKGWDVLSPSATLTKYHLPVLKNMYLDAMRRSKSLFYAFANSDILFTNSLVDTLKGVIQSKAINLSSPVLIIGKRTNVLKLKTNESRTFRDIRLTAKKRGGLFTSLGEDYFITTANYPWDSIPNIVVGRVAYDNWLVWNSKRLRHQTIDATGTLLAVHQTTASGNGEGRRQPLKKFNADMLHRMYTSFKYWAGRTLCADYVTRNVKRGLVIKKRKLGQRCLP